MYHITFTFITLITHRNLDLSITIMGKMYVIHVLKMYPCKETEAADNKIVAVGWIIIVVVAAVEVTTSKISEDAIKSRILNILLNIYEHRTLKNFALYIARKMMEITKRATFNPFMNFCGVIKLFRTNLDVYCLKTYFFFDECMQQLTFLNVSINVLGLGIVFKIIITKLHFMLHYKLYS